MYKEITPSELADALESGEYNHIKGKMGGRVNNCCLGVYARKCGIAVGKLAGMDNLSNLTYPIDDFPHPKWMSTNIENLLIALNDHDIQGLKDKYYTKAETWPKIIIPFLRMLKVNKDGSLSAHQLKLIQVGLERDHFIDSMVVDLVNYILKKSENA